MNLLRFGICACLVTLGSACIPEYEPPTLAEPHATIKVRRTYDMAAGSALSERLLVDDHSALLDEIPAQLALSPRIDAVLAHPVPATFQMHGRFFHREWRTVQETYYVSESYTETESYSCGTATSYRSCSRTVTRYRQVPRQRTVTKLVEVTDAACAAQNRFTPKPDRVYLLQFNFQEHEACSLSCFEQVPGDGQTFRNLPCPPAPPE